jgi:hypothetical protein
MKHFPPVTDIYNRQGKGNYRISHAYEEIDGKEENQLDATVTVYW